jgi:hypothetical protein
VFDDPKELLYWSAIWQKLLMENKPDSWAYRWTFTCLINGGLTALPNVNLVSNIGFGADGTHTSGASFFVESNSGIGSISAPQFALRDVIADRYTFNKVFCPESGFKSSTYLISAVKKIVRRISRAITPF